MTKYYGVGTWWNKDKEQHYKEFIDGKKACISTILDKPTKRENENRKKFREIFLSIHKKNIIYLKVYDILNQKFRIRAVGTVKANPQNNNLDCIYCVGINYHSNHNFDGLKDFNDGVKRNTRIYQETNIEVIRFIDSILQI